MVEQFQDVIALNIPNWYNNSFAVDAVDCEDGVLQELIELQNDNDTTMRYHCNGKEGGCGVSAAGVGVAGGASASVVAGVSVVPAVGSFAVHVIAVAAGAGTTFALGR
ncbi:Hypothetical predicted protein [Octopus vulgaris]|uniref:Uncharacterized protein n=1 Tax=Octopus vulgaris TaxID=6645 RepID=A0AA36F1T1_OCTVU|nr:Hypothetical predicted protein [Octopus vulgaris]